MHEARAGFHGGLPQHLLGIVDRPRLTCSARRRIAPIARMPLSYLLANWARPKESSRSWGSLRLPTSYHIICLLPWFGDPFRSFQGAERHVTVLVSDGSRTGTVRILRGIMSSRRVKGGMSEATNVRILSTGSVKPVSRASILRTSPSRFFVHAS